MGKRGPKSSSELATVPIGDRLQVQARPDAPYDLPDEAAEVWKATLEALPADWLGAEAHPVLAAYCRVTVQLRRLGQLIHQSETGSDQLDLVSYTVLIKTHGAAAQVLKTLGTALRLTPQTRLRAETAARKADGTPLASKPWEFRANVKERT
jgi:phage terminase small subunit